MSKAGSSPCRARDGRLVGKFNGTVYHFGRASDPESYAAFNRFKGDWEDAGRTVTRQMVKEIGYVPKDPSVEGVTAETVTIQQLRDSYVAGLEERGAEWTRNNLARYEYALKPLVDLFGTETISAVAAGCHARQGAAHRAGRRRAVMRHWETRHDLRRALIAGDGLGAPPSSVEPGHEKRLAAHALRVLRFYRAHPCHDRAGPVLAGFEGELRRSLAIAQRTGLRSRFDRL